ncbi:diguanylate cyclase [Vibrio sp. 10N.286.55.E10]|uniref:GGDEF domain-containing protein n=1 Tax=unclassified Vibrio TaxID=2614977 RepID=UPI000C8196F0|nr:MULTISPECIES: diguanylate cyclase [unclassified Vibrio]PME34742.1 diguanylate cyclase [Vibrio sp. 10N.286.55.E10]PME43568.1 diguanylate cyclase [Vibrio sp. 10N.286.55.E12]PME67154.1 diguanylate cyclase [Vibrio sp. 10N.286.55.C11]PTP17271.1 diguanylate cyclase [Vibrio sp. 10N.286.51.C3]TKE60915.1 sensor domain-containing diguanylate cyclase [Vibrio sp. F12]
MPKITLGMDEFHRIMQVIDNVDAGLLIVDLDYNVCIWNSFMQSYSKVSAEQIMGKNLFNIFPDLPEKWLRTKVSSSISVQSRTFSSWENRPFLFNFNNYSPVSNGLSVMYQDISITPLTSLSGEISHISILVNDVSDTAKSKLYLNESNTRLSKISQIDGLTGLYNRAYWECCLKEEFHRCKTMGKTATLVMFDIDHFKKVNDIYGHSVGDEVIRQTSHTVQEIARRSDYAGRYGGEEFVVFLPNTSTVQAHNLAERLRKKIESLFISTKEHNIQITISLGLCEITDIVKTAQDLIEKADKALYDSKEGGRNQTSIYSSQRAGTNVNY